MNLHPGYAIGEITNGGAPTVLLNTNWGKMIPGRKGQPSLRGSAARTNAKHSPGNPNWGSDSRRLVCFAAVAMTVGRFRHNHDAPESPAPHAPMD
jgi:hypothetical protein